MAFDLDIGADTVVNIKVLGIGGGGNNVVNRMINTGMRGVEFIAINTDMQALKTSSATQKIQIGEKLTRGQGAGSTRLDVSRLRRAGHKSPRHFKGTNMVFITAGMGGGTGTGGARLLGEIAHEMGI